eukprot:15335692-Ditylum_brightwellii.AAC.1
MLIILPTTSEKITMLQLTEKEPNTVALHSNGTTGMMIGYISCVPAPHPSPHISAPTTNKVSI